MSKRLADVAKKVGVSEATVSRVLNEKPGVADATREAVLTALDVLGYERPSKLRGERARLVGLVLPELQNPIFPALADVVGGALVQHGYTPLLYTLSASGVTEADCVDLMLEQQVSGVIFLGGNFNGANSPHEHYQRLIKVRLPTVLFNARAKNVALPSVATDDVSAAEQAVRHLHQLGHRRIGLLMGTPDSIPSERKVMAARAMLERLGSPLDPALVVRGLYSLEGGQNGGARLLAQGATGLVCASDVLALGAIRAARRVGLRVPDDVSIVGYDDSPLMSITEPPLTTMRQPIDAMGRTALELLQAQMLGTSTDSEELLFDPELVLRGSTGPVRA